MAETKGVRKGRNDKGKYRKNKAVEVPKAVEAERPEDIPVDPLYSTYDAPKPEGAYFDEAAADHVCDWIETELRHFEGKFAGKPFFLLDWQRRLLRHIFGWKRQDGFRLYRRIYCEVGRKQGKSTLASAIALYLAFGDEENAPQIVFAGMDKDQAGICYKAARNILTANQKLYSEAAVYSAKNEIQLRNNPGGWLKPVSADAKRLFGLNIHGLIFDELFTQTNRDLWTSLTTSSGAREQPLIFCISTAGWNQATLCFEQHELVREIQEGTAEDEEFFGVVYGLDQAEDWTDSENWMKSNPSLGQTVGLSFYEGEYRKVKALPREENAFRTFYLSQWVGQETRYIPMEHWDQCNGPVELPRKRKAFAGLDLSATTDLTALTVVAENASGGLDVFSYPFLPGDHLDERERRDRVPYGMWAKEGYLTLTPGRTIRYRAIKERVLAVAQEFELVDIGYDRHEATMLVQELEDDGITMVQIGQGYTGISAGTKSLLQKVMDHSLSHGADPLLRWCAGNFVAKEDEAGNVKPDKAKATQRIDPAVALIMALDGYNRRGKTAKKKTAYSGGFYDQFVTDKPSFAAA
jgi:phage terminase large subunit-like protein